MAVTLVLACWTPRALPADGASGAFRDYRQIFYGFGIGLAAGVLATSKSGLVGSEPNRHSSERKDRLEIVSWNGVEVRLRRTSFSPKVPLVESLVVRRPGFRLGYGLKIGSSTREDVEKVLGPPDRSDESSTTYDGPSELCQDGYGFRFNRNVLVRAEWNWCSD